MKYILSILFTIVVIASSVFAQGDLRQRLLRKAMDSHSESVSVMGKSQKDQILSAPNVTLIKDAQWQNNPSVVINRKNSNLIVVGADDDFESQLGMPVYLTDDAGISWTTFRVPRIFGWQPGGNPILATDNEGRFYYLYDGFNFTYSAVKLFVANSTDGVHWKYGKPVTDTTNPAKESLEYRAFMTVDNSSGSPYYGRVYVVWMHLDPADSLTEARLSWSDDHAMTWTPPLALPKDGGADALQIHTGLKGEVCISYSTFGDSSGTHIMQVSKDGCTTFSKHVIASFRHYPLNSDPQESLKGQKGISAFASVAFSIDQNRINAVYGTWKKWDSVHASAALYYRNSDDFGLHWSDSLLLGNVRTLDRDRFFPFLSRDAGTRETSLIYYSSEQDSANIGTTVYRSVLSENGPSSAISLRDNLFDPLQCTANLQTTVGDYIGSDADNGVFAAAWTTFEYTVIIIRPDQRGMSDVIVYVNSPASAVRIPVKVNADRLWLSEPFPNPPSSKETIVNFTIPSSAFTSLSLYDETGKKIKDFFHRDFHEGSYTEALDLSGFTSGNYFLQLKTDTGMLQKKIILTQ